MVFQFIKSGYQKLRNALASTGSLLGNKIRALFIGQINQETLDELERILYEADLGVQTAGELTKKIQELHQQNPDLDGEGYLSALREEIKQTLMYQPSATANPSEKAPLKETPLVFLIIGVNGNGKTTSVAKLAKRFQDEGKKVLLAAADTFRAAAAEQLEAWANRLNIDIVKGAPNSDPAAVVFDALSAAKARNAEIILIDTAGRLHTKTHLMQELEKIKRTCKKFSPDSPHETLLVLDATTGQNAIDQAKTFHKFTPISGLFLTKLDGSAKGGIAVAIQREIKVPIKFIGVGEGIEDIEAFDAENFVNTLFA